MAYLKGYSAVPGTARRVRTPDGDIISHRQYRNIEARELGWRSLSEAENDTGWKHWQHKIREANPKAKTDRGSNKGRKLQADYVQVKRRREKVPPKRTVRGWEHDPTLEPTGRKMNQTPLGRLLEAIGAVDDGDTWSKYPTR